MQAIVYKSTGSWYLVKTHDGKSFNARIKGSMKLGGITSTNPIAVGDLVEIIPDTESEQSVVITEIKERDNYIARVSPHNKNQHHIVGANLDQTLLFATLRNPKTSSGFIDRFLISAEAFHVPAILVFNKIDIYRKKEIDLLEIYTDLYNKIGYKVMLISMETEQGLRDLKYLLKDKTTLISGHSGVGKSTFVNTVHPEVSLKTGEVSGWSGKGMHTTTFSEMIDLPFGGKVIDTPGIREFGVLDISRQELSHYFPEMRARIHDCKFNNCLHLDEPGCAITEAVINGEIAEERYISYCKILDTISDKNY
ncbi:ribosome small subunit-dependent GTPase A [Arachidicoccus terrestris]|uniref:ribosome small subunit-dependent GTPase A n=1 Tax=Arachidicoccus terrestris TaxID=2875539 RepID=UPI001CC708DF|nr:ribosome small subunit-dependent GTPase A [Arachidicoccus terrestris]UAY54037.1 ribosome small subunit-dependent GTPase A [Arachidicoccus terrestris]